MPPDIKDARKDNDHVLPESLAWSSPHVGSTVTYVHVFMN